MSKICPVKFTDNTILDIKCYKCGTMFNTDDNRIGLILTKCPDCAYVIEYGEFANIKDIEG